jgi:hypothetical protein
MLQQNRDVNNMKLLYLPERILSGANGYFSGIKTAPDFGTV